MTDDLQERLRRSLATRADDVRPDPATWARVEARIRRRTWARWSLAGLTVAAVLAVAALTLPGILNGTRVDLSPADPPPPAGATTLVTTDGQRVYITDLDGEVLDEIEPPTEADDPLPITRVAVRPGSTPDDLTVVYLRADAACERVEMGWVTVDADGTSGGALGGGQGFCMTDPVWSPEGDAVAWVEQSPGDEPTVLHVRDWGSTGPGTLEPAAGDTRLVFGVPDATAVRATDWWWNETDDAGAEGIASLSVVRTGIAQAFVLPVERQADGAVTLLDGAPARTDPVHDEEIRSALLASDHGGASGGRYELGVDASGDVLLSRWDDDAEPEPARAPLGPGVLSAEDVDRGDAWLSARGDIVVFGAGGSGWLLDFPAGSYTALPGVVHAAVLAPAAGDSAPDRPAPVGPARIATEGSALTLTAADGQTVLTEAVSDEITDFTVHPDSTPEDLTVVWREGTGCESTLRHLTVVGGDAGSSGTLPAGCPGRPVFAPDGSHIAWVSDDWRGGEEFALETLAWDDGPADSLVTFGLPADPVELGHLTLLDWTWAADGAVAAGLLHLSGTDGHGTVSALTARVERQGDGALALPAGATAEQVTPFEFGSDQDRFAVLQAGSGAADGTAPRTYTLETRVRGDAADDLVVVPDLDGDEADHAFVLPSGLLRVNTTGEVDAVWMTARGSDVLLGDGAGRVFSLRWTGDGWSELGELDTRARYAVPLAGQPTGPPEPGTDPSPGPPSATETPDPAPPEPDPDPDTQGLPSPVADTRLAILQAARAGDVEALAGLTGEGFTSSFGGPEDPLAFFTRLRDEGELDRLVRILELPHGEQGGMYSWPFAYTRDLESLSSAELELLATVATQEEIDSWFEFGGYAGWRAGIDDGGTWRFYVAGD